MTMLSCTVRERTLDAHSKSENQQLWDADC